MRHAQLAHERFLVPKNEGSLLIPLQISCASLKIKLEKDAADNELHLVHCHILAYAVSRTCGKRSKTLVIISLVVWIIEPALRNKAIRVTEVVRAVVCRIVVDRHTSSCRHRSSWHVLSRCRGWHNSRNPHWYRGKQAEGFFDT